MHASRRFIGDLDGVLQDALWDDVALGGGGRLSADKHPKVFMASLCLLLQKFLQRTQPASHQVDVLQSDGDTGPRGRESNLLVCWGISSNTTDKSFCWASVNVWALMDNT